MVATRNKGSRNRNKSKTVGGCICCAEKGEKKKTKCSELLTHNGKTDNNNFLRDRVSKKPSGKKSPITPCTVVLYRQNSGPLEPKTNSITLEANRNGHTPGYTPGQTQGRTSEQCVNMVSNWLRTFQQKVTIQPRQEEAMEEESSPPPVLSPQEPSTSGSPQNALSTSGSPQQQVDDAPHLLQVESVAANQEVVCTAFQEVALTSASATAGVTTAPTEYSAGSHPSTAGVVSPPLEYPAGSPPSTSSAGVVSPPIEYPSGGPASVGSSVSAPISPSSEMSFSQDEAESTASQEEPDSTSSTAGKPARTPARKEKQRIASMKSRKKKNAEQEALKLKEKALKTENARLEKQIENMEKERVRYLSGEFEYEHDKDIIDPYEDEDSDEGAVGASASATS